MTSVRNTIDQKEKMVLNATYAAMFCSAVLAFLKYVNFYITGSVALYATFLDSSMDFAVSTVNLFAIYIIKKKPNNLFIKGYDKIAALVAFFQVIFISILAISLFFDCINKFWESQVIESAGYGIAILCVSLLINTILVTYQTKVINITNSIIVRADMLHYKTDFLTNMAIMIGIIFVWNFNIYWLDPAIGILASLYLFVAISSLLKLSVRALLDINNSTLATQIFQEINKNVMIKQENVFVLFSGTKEKVYIQTENFTEIAKIKEIVANNFKLSCEIIYVQN